MWPPVEETLNQCCSLCLDAIISAVWSLHFGEPQLSISTSTPSQDAFQAAPLLWGLGNGVRVTISPDVNFHFLLLVDAPTNPDE